MHRRPHRAWCWLREERKSLLHAGGEGGDCRPKYSGVLRKCMNVRRCSRRRWPSSWTTTFRRGGCYDLEDDLCAQHAEPSTVELCVRAPRTSGARAGRSPARHGSTKMQCEKAASAHDMYNRRVSGRLRREFSDIIDHFKAHSDRQVVRDRRVSDAARIFRYRRSFHRPFRR